MQAFKSRLFAAKTGALVALLGATVLTAVPTGAVAAPTFNVTGSGKSSFVAYFDLGTKGVRACQSHHMKFVTLKNVKEEKRGGVYYQRGQAVCRK